MLLSVARWWVMVVGGFLIGAGALLYGQVTTLHYLRHEVHSTFFLWRSLGKLTFVWQDDVTKAALWADECPIEVLRESERGAMTLVVVGAILAIGSLFLRRPRARRARR